MSFLTTYLTPELSPLAPADIAALAERTRVQVLGGHPAHAPVANLLDLYLYSIGVKKQSLGHISGRTALALRIDGQDGNGGLMGTSYVSDLLPYDRAAVVQAISIGFLHLHFLPFVASGVAGPEVGFMVPATVPKKDDPFHLTYQQAVLFATHLLVPVEQAKRAYATGGLAQVCAQLAIPEYFAHNALARAGVAVPA